MCSRSLFDRSLKRPRVDAGVLLRSKIVLPLRRFGIRGTLWQQDRLDSLSGFGWHASRQHRTLQKTFVSVPVDSKHYPSYSFAFVNHQAGQFRRCSCQLQSGKKDVYLFPESSVRKWRHCAFLHSVEVFERTFVSVAVDSKHCLSYGFADTSALSPLVLVVVCSLLK